MKSEKTSLATKIIATEIVPFTSDCTVAVPGITVEGLKLKETTYNVPLRNTGSTLIGDLQDNVNKIQADEKNPKLFFHGTGTVVKKDIEVTLGVSSLGELTGDLAKAFQADATIEIIKTALSSTLKAAVKTTLEGKAAIKGTLEILYLKGYELMQL